MSVISKVEEVVSNIVSFDVPELTETGRVRIVAGGGRKLKSVISTNLNE